MLLCLSNPGGPLEFAQCRPPIQRLYRHLARGGGFPSCAMAGSAAAGGSWAEPVHEPYDPCPAGLAPAPAGQAVAQDAAAGRLRVDVSKAMDWRRDQPEPGPRACVAGLVERLVERTSDDRERMVFVYEQVTWLEAQPPRAIDVHIAGRLYRRVRY